MTAEDLDLVVSATNNGRFRWLTSEDNPDARQRDGYRRAVEAMADRQRRPSEYPPLAAQIGSAIGALGRVAGALVTGGAVVVDQAEQERRLSVCRACPEFVADAVRCLKCGCALPLKTRLQTEDCPLGKWPAITAQAARLDDGTAQADPSGG